MPNRSLTPEFKQDLRRALQIWEGPLREGFEPAHILDQIARHIEGLLELPPEVTADWYKP